MRDPACSVRFVITSGRNSLYGATSCDVGWGKEETINPSRFSVLTATSSATRVSERSEADSRRNGKQARGEKISRRAWNYVPRGANRLYLESISRVNRIAGRGLRNGGSRGSRLRILRSFDGRSSVSRARRETRRERLTSRERSRDQVARSIWKILRRDRHRRQI